jgi:hypothetical protein
VKKEQESMALSWLKVLVSGMALVMSAGSGNEPPVWLDDYAAAMDEAKRTGRMMVVYFHEDGLDCERDKLYQKLMTDETVRPMVSGHVLVRIPMSRRATVGGKDMPLINHVAFAELQKQPGLAIIDLTDPHCDHYGHVVSVYPLSLPNALNTHPLQVLFDLPRGSLTQRTLIWAVRIHPENPGSADGEFLPTLAEESESHAQYQARLNRQGHHHWESRFHRISRRLPGGLLAQEVCAESWPGQGLIAAALDCVASWRHSSGHWNAVRGRHPYFGYDMKRGQNGIWYATGIFSVRR